jgi:integrase
VEDDQSQSGRTPRKARSAEDRAQIGHNDRCADNRNGDGYRARAAAFHSPGARCGLRRGEITALRRKAIDLDIGQLAVIASTEQLDAGDKSKRIREKEAKSGKARTVAQPSLAIEELRRWRPAQAEELLKLGIRTDDSWHVVTAADGSTPQPRSSRAVSKFLKEWGLTLHGLQHSHANYMLASNVHPKIMQERLGHSSIGITLDIYSHLMPNMQEGAAATVDGVLRPAINKRADDVG